MSASGGQRFDFGPIELALYIVLATLFLGVELIKLPYPLISPETSLMLRLWNKTRISAEFLMRKVFAVPASLFPVCPNPAEEDLLPIC